MTIGSPRATAERTARTSYGRLVAILATPTGDLALAEDCLSAAFEQALTTWPRSGVPDNPEGWLLTVARNRQRDVWKSASHRTTAPITDATDRGLDATSPLEGLDPDAIPEKRLELLFVCAHPAINATVRTPLMLQTVLGLDAAQIAGAFAVAPATMAQRLVRAKQRIKVARIPFAVPDRRMMPERLPPVLEAIYGCYAIAWPDAALAAAPAPDSLAGEAHYLAVTLASLLDTEPEAWGLAALITLSLSRVGATSGGFVPLEEQDAGRWDAGLIAEGDDYLRRAAAVGSAAGARGIGRFELEAAIQAVHCDRARTGATDWAALQTLYRALQAVAPNLGAQVAAAAVTGRIEGPLAGLERLAALGDGAARFQPFHATRAGLLSSAGRATEAAEAFAVAASLTHDPAVRTYLHSRGRR